MPNDGERQHRRTRVVGEHAGVARRPARGQLGPVEQDRQHQRRPDRAQQVGHGVEAGEVLADDGDDGDPAAELDELDRPAGHLHRLPPAQRRVQGAAEVVLEDLTLVERPAMVLVLAVVPPPPAEPHADVHPVARQAARRRSTCRGRRRSARRRRAGRARPRGRRSRSSGTALSGSTTMSTTSTSSSAAASTSVDELEVEPARPGRTRRSRTARARSRWTDAACGRKSLSPDAQRPRQQQEVGRLTARVEPGRWAGTLCHTASTAATAHAGVAGERPQRDAAGGCAHLGQHAQARAPDPGQRPGAGEELAARGRARAAPAAGRPSTATPMPAHASSATACSVSSAAQIGQSSPVGDVVERRGDGIADDGPRRRRPASGGRPSPSRWPTPSMPRRRPPRVGRPVGHVGRRPGSTGRRRHDEAVGLGLLEDDLGQGEHVGRPLEQVVVDRLAGDGSPHDDVEAWSRSPVISRSARPSTPASV